MSRSPRSKRDADERRYERKRSRSPRGEDGRDAYYQAGMHRRPRHADDEHWHHTPQNPYSSHAYPPHSYANDREQYSIRYERHDSRWHPSPSHHDARSTEPHAYASHRERPGPPPSSDYRDIRHERRHHERARHPGMPPMSRYDEYRSIASHRDDARDAPYDTRRDYEAKERETASKEHAREGSFTHHTPRPPPDGHPSSLPHSHTQSAAYHDVSELQKRKTVIPQPTLEQIDPRPEFHRKRDAEIQKLKAKQAELQQQRRKLEHVWHRAEFELSCATRDVERWSAQLETIQTQVDAFDDAPIESFISS